MFRTTTFAFALGLGLAAIAPPSVAQEPLSKQREAIPLDQLEEMFWRIRTQTNWNVEGDLLWGYFFLDPEPEKLRLLGSELTRSSYRLVGVFPANSGGGYVLHVEKIETHTPASLQQRNTQLSRMADTYGIATYDGMDVGPVPGR